MHTAQHLMSGIAYEIFNGIRTVGNQIHTSHSRIDFNPVTFDQAMLEELCDAVNNLTSQSIPVTFSTMTREEINKLMPKERTNMDLLPKSVKNLRVVKIGDDIDLCPCAGTHVKNLQEIGQISIIGKKSKGKGTQRITYEINNNKLTKPSKAIPKVDRSDRVGEDIVVNLNASIIKPDEVDHLRREKKDWEDIIREVDDILDNV